MNSKRMNTMRGARLAATLGSQSSASASKMWLRAFALVLLITAIAGPERAAAYDVCSDGESSPGAGDGRCAHEEMAEYGASVYNSNHSFEVDDLDFEKIQAIRRGAEHEDQFDHIYGFDGDLVTVTHFWDPDPDGIYYPLNTTVLDGAAIFHGNLPNNWQKSQAYWSRALAEYAVGNFNKETGAYHFLGHVVHHMGDNTIPTHVHLTSHGPLNRDSFENWMSGKRHGAFDVVIPLDEKPYLLGDDGFELSALTFNHQPKLGRIDPLKYADLNFDIPEVAEVERPDMKLLWLLYTTNQIAEFFAADRDDGEAYDPKGWAQADLNKMLNAGLRPTTEDQMADNDSCDCNDDVEHDLGTIREYSYLRGIRAIGGLYNLFEQTVSTKPIVVVTIHSVEELKDCGDAPLDEACDFYGRVSFQDVSKNTQISAQNEGHEMEDGGFIEPDWKWGHAVETSGYMHIVVEILDEDNVDDDPRVKIIPEGDEDVTNLTLGVDLAKCLSGDVGAIVAEGIPGKSGSCGQRIKTTVTGKEDEDEGIAAVTFSVTMFETSPPVISCAAADGVWHGTDVSIACTAVDEGVGLANPADAAFSLWTSVLSGTETDNAATGTKEVCDAVGNCATAGPVSGNRVDKKAPVITIVQPTAGQYVHSATLVLDYTVTDGGSGVWTVTPTMNGSTTVAGNDLSSGQAIDLLTSLPLGANTFTVNAIDNVSNASPPESVTFTIIVTPQSIIDAVNQLWASGAIDRKSVNPLLAKLSNAQRKWNQDQCDPAGNMYGAFINHVQAQSGKSITPVAAEILIADAQYLITHCGDTDLEDDPIFTDGFEVGDTGHWSPF